MLCCQILYHPCQTTFAATQPPPIVLCEVSHVFKTKMFQLEPLWNVHQWKETIALMGVKRFSNHAMIGLKVKLFSMSCLEWLDQFIMHCGTILTFPKSLLYFPTSLIILEGINLMKRWHPWLSYIYCNEILLQSPQMVCRKVILANIMYCIATQIWGLKVCLFWPLNPIQCCLQFFVAWPPFFQHLRR